MSLRAFRAFPETLSPEDRARLPEAAALYSIQLEERSPAMGALAGLASLFS